MEPAQHSRRYLRLRFRTPGGLEGAWAAELWSLGTLGLESAGDPADGDEYFAYFASPAAAEVEDLMRSQHPRIGGPLIEVVEIAGEDWQRAYRLRAAPFAVGEGWWIDPREPTERPTEIPPGRRLLRIPARTAFGTGSHASTALAVALMEELPLEGARVLDVGTGSGILSMIALSSGARQVLAFDIDSQAVFVAHETCRLNQLRPQLMAGELAALAPAVADRRFDLVVANVLPGHLRSRYPRLAACLRPGGHLVLSGLLEVEAGEITAELEGFDCVCRSRRTQEEWAALVFEKEAS